MASHKNSQQDLDPASSQALQAALRLAFNVLLQAPLPADFPTAPPPPRAYLQEYRCWHEEQLLPLREILFELVQGTADPTPSETIH